MNTEKLKTLEQIHIALETIEQTRGADISVNHQFQLEKIVFKLWNMEQALIRKLGTELTDALSKDTASLNYLIKKLKLDTNSLKQVIESIEKAIKTTKALIKILEIALKVGLV